MDLISVGIGLAKFVPEIIGLFGGDKAEEVSKDVIRIAESVTGFSGKVALAEIENSTELQIEFKRQVLNKRVELEKAYLEDVQNARSMQIEVVKTEHWLSRNFIYLFALFVTIIVFAYMVFVSIAVIPDANRSLVDHTTGFFQTVVTAVVAYFFGTTKGSSGKQEQIKNLTSQLSKLMNKEK